MNDCRRQAEGKDGPEAKGRRWGLPLNNRETDRNVGGSILFLCNLFNAAGAFERRAALVAAKRTRCRTSEIAGWAGVVVARRADTLTHTPLRMVNRSRLTARLFSSGWRAGTALRSGDMPTRLPWWDLAANRGHDAECVF